jgi:hypothetical protein
MAKLSIKDALEKFKGVENNEFFTLKNDGDSAVVRFLYDVSTSDVDTEDLDAYPVHEVMINGKKRYIKCSQESDCEGCRKLGKPVLKMFAQVLDERDGKVKTWERGRTFVVDLIGYINKYGKLSGRKYEIVRHGKAGDQQTKYQMFPLDRDELSYAALQEKGVNKQDLVARKGFILERTNDEVNKIITTGVDPVAAQDANAGVTQRTNTSGTDVF